MSGWLNDARQESGNREVKATMRAMTYKEKRELRRAAMAPQLADIIEGFIVELHPKNWTQFLEVQFFYVKIFKRSKRKGYLSF